MTGARPDVARPTGLLAAGLAVLALVVPMPHARACDGRYTVTATTVTDNDTHLVWQLVVQTTGTTPCPLPPAVPPKGCYSGSGAIAYCTGLPHPGLTPFRLPTILELQTLVDESTNFSFQGKAAIASPFTSTTPVDAYWSATAVAGTSNEAYYVDFSDGTVWDDDKGSFYHVRCVTP